MAYPVSITHKAFIKLLLSNLKIKPDDRRAANATGTWCRFKTKMTQGAPTPYVRVDQ
jgi:hypothetical protein